MEKAPKQALLVFGVSYELYLFAGMIVTNPSGSCFLRFWYSKNQVIVKVGIRSRPGINSSKKLKRPPSRPLLFIPNMRTYIIAEIGAKSASTMGPRKGIARKAKPIRSIKRHEVKEGRGLCFAAV